MQEMTRAEPGGEMVHTRALSPDEQSIGELVTRLAQESRDLAAIELRRVRVEMREQSRRAARAAAAGYVAVDFVALATLALAVGVFLVLAGWWDSYVAAAFVTSGLLAVVALVAGVVVRGMMRRMLDTGSLSDDENQ